MATNPFLPPAKRAGRPSSYTEAMGDEICDRLANGESLEKIANDLISDTGEYAIYGLHNPIDGTLKYIGMTKNPKQRLAQHYRANPNRWGETKIVKWLRELRENGLKPDMKILHWTNNWEIAERFWISTIKRTSIALLNTAAGGTSNKHMRAVRVEHSEWAHKHTPVQYVQITMGWHIRLAKKANSPNVEKYQHALRIFKAHIRKVKNTLGPKGIQALNEEVIARGLYYAR